MKLESRYKYDIAVILPTYNESENVSIIIEKIQKALKGRSFQIIVVDDNSPDRTWEIAQKIAHKHHNITVIRRLHESGLSSAIIEGFSLADSDAMVVMDADLQHDETILPRFIDGFRQGYEIIVGSRKTDGGEIAEWSWSRRLISWVATKMALLVLRNNVSDPMSGFFGVSKKVLESSTGKINPRGFKLLLEILAHNPGAKALEIGYTFKKRIHGKSKLSTNVILDYLVALYSLSLGKYVPLRFIKYSIVGLSGLILNHLTLFSGKTIDNLDSDTLFLAALEISILNNFYWNNTWTFHDLRIRGYQLLLAGVSFHLVSAIGAIINYSLIYVLQNRISLTPLAAGAFGLFVSTIWNYRINYQMTWKKEL